MIDIREYRPCAAFERWRQSDLIGDGPWVPMLRHAWQLIKKSMDMMHSEEKRMWLSANKDNIVWTGKVDYQ